MKVTLPSYRAAFPNGRPPAWPGGIAQSWERFLATDQDRPAGLDLYDDLFEFGSLMPLQRKRELTAMIRRARGIKPKTIMEIGSDKAGGFYHWIKCLPTVRKAIGVEWRGTPQSEVFEAAFPDVQFLWLEGSSRDPVCIEEVAKFLGDDKLNILFIDGDKSAMRQDFNTYRPMVAAGGIVFLHDFRDETGPKAAFRSLASEYPAETILDTSESEEAMAREAAGEKSSGAHESWLRHWKGQSCGVGVFQL